MRPALPSAERGMGGALLLLLAVLFVAHLPMLSDHPYGAHTWRMGDTAAMARNFVADRYDLLHPRIDWDRGESGHVQTELPVYTWTVAFLWGALGEHMIVAELLSLLLAVAAYFCFYRFACHLLDRSRALLATALVGLTPLVFYFSMSVQPESTVLLCSYGALWGWVSYVRTRRTVALLAWAAALTVGASIKPQILILLAPMAGMVGALPGERPWAWKAPALAQGAGMLLPLAWFWHGHHIYLQSHNSFGITTSGGADKFSILLRLRQPQWWRVMTHDILSFSWLLPALPFVGLGAIRAWRDPAWRFLHVWVGVVLLSFVLLAEAVWTMNYYQLPLAAPTALLATLGLSVAWEQVRRPVAMRGLGALLLVVVAGGIAVGLAGTWGLLDGWVERELRPGGAVEGLLRTRGVGAGRLEAVARHALHSMSFNLVGWGLVLAALLAARWGRMVPSREGSAMGIAGALALLVLAAWPLSMAAGLRELWHPEYQPQYEAGVHLKRLFPPRTLGILGHQVYKRPHGYDPEPVIFYYGNMRGWVVPERDYRPGLVDTLTAQGARFFATTHLRELDRHPEFTEALERHGRLEERSLDYAIYRLGDEGGGTR